MANLTKNVTKVEKTKWENNLYIYEAALEVLKTKIKLVKIEYDMLAKKENYSEIQMITDRIKSLESIIGKLAKNNLDFTVQNVNDRIHDVVGCRIVCLTLDDVKAMIELLRKTLNATEGFRIDKEKDYINNPKENGYQSYHFRVVVPVTFSGEKYDVPCEIQVRTLLMHAWAELEHKVHYKADAETQKIAGPIKAQFAGLAKSIEATDQFVALSIKSK